MHLLCLPPAAPPPRCPRLPSLPPALPGRRCREEGAGGEAGPTWRQKRVRVSPVRVTAGQPTPTPQLPPEDKSSSSCQWTLSSAQSLTVSIIESVEYSFLGFICVCYLYTEYISWSPYLALRL